MSDEICLWSARRMVEAVRAREVSCRELLEAHVERIDRINPLVNAVVTLVPERARDEADRADRALAAGEETGPLHGLPIAHKDTHLTAGIRTTQGSRLFADQVPGQDELVVRRVRAAGAISIGKTNVPELAAGSHTFNEVFGATRNPYDPGRSAGGSSGGAAAALACGLQPIADGSDMGGSLRNPASFCNVVGLRPSAGLVPTYPSLLPWSPLAVQGPMARTVDDVALLLSVMAGPDRRAPLATGADPSVFASLPDADLRGLRVAWSPDLGGSVPVDPAVTEVLAGQLPVLAEMGCVVEEASPSFAGADETFRTLRAWQFDLALGDLHARNPGVLKASLAHNIEAGRDLTGHDVAVAHRRQGELYHRVRSFFETYDVLLLPVSQTLPFDVDLEYPELVAGEQQRDYLGWMRSASHVSLTGCPALSVPGGFSREGLPVGLQVVGPHGADLLVLQVGRAFEAATGFGARRPELHPS